MSKFGALVLILVLFGAIFYVYNQNVNNVGVKIDKLKLKYTIDEGATPEKLLLFSENLSQLALSSTNTDKKRLEFEAKFWNATGLAKDVAGKLNTGENFTDNCTNEVPTMKTDVKNAQQALNESKLEFELIKDQYTNVEQKDFESRFDNITYSLTASENLLYIFCP